mgnify:CR=1 FL=1
MIEFTEGIYNFYVYILTNKVSDFTHGNGNPMVKGYYIVVESIFYKDYAEQEMKRYMSFGRESSIRCNFSFL